MDNKLRGQVEDLKKQGNDLFINRKYEEAIRVYSKVLNHSSFRGVTNDGMEPKEILLKQSFYLMRGRAYENVGKSERAKKDFDMCIEILDNTKYAFKARLVRAQLDIQTVEHLKLAKLDCEAVMKAPRKAIEEQTRSRAKGQLQITIQKLAKLQKRKSSKQGKQNGVHRTSTSSNSQSHCNATNSNQSSPSKSSTSSNSTQNGAPPPHSINSNKNTHTNTNNNNNNDYHNKMAMLNKQNRKILSNLSTRMSLQQAKIMQLNNNGSFPPNEDYVFLVPQSWWQKWINIDQSGDIADESNAELLVIDNRKFVDPEYLKNGFQTSAKPEEEEKDDSKEKELQVESWFYTPLRKGLKMGKDFAFLSMAAFSYLMNELGYQCPKEIKAYIYRKEFNKARNEYVLEIELYRTTFFVHYQKQNEPKKMLKIKASLQEPVRRIEFVIASYLVCQASFIRLRHGSFDGPIWDESNLLDQLDVLQNPNIYVEIRLPNGCWPSTTTFASMTSAHLMDEYMKTPNDDNSNSNTNKERKDNENELSTRKDNDNTSVEDVSNSISKISISNNNNTEDKSEETTTTTTTTQCESKTNTNTNTDTNNPPNRVCHCCYRLIDHFVACQEQPCEITYCSHLHQEEHFQEHMQLVHNPRRVGMHRFHGRRGGPRHGLTGLVNLHNSCYMNSSLQCLSWIPELRAYFISGDYFDDLNTDNPLGYGGKLAELYSRFLRQTWWMDNHQIQPREMRYGIGKLNQTWNSPQQQDAQEFVDWFLDGLHEDTNRVKKKPYYELPDSDLRADEIVANEAWELHLKRNQSIIIDTFQGQIKSTLRCPVCDYVSVKFDPFSVLQLPIPEREHEQHLPCLIFEDLQQPPRSVTMTVSSKATLLQLIDKINDSFHIKGQLLVCKVSENEFQKYYSAGRGVQYVRDNLKKPKNFIYIYQVETTTVSQRKKANIIQCRMNFFFREMNDDFDDNNGSDSDISDNSIKRHFTFPILFETQAPLTGNKIYEVLNRRFEYLTKSRDEMAKDDNIDVNQLPPFPRVALSVRVGRDSKENIKLNDEALPLTKEDKFVATIDVEISEFDFHTYMNKLQISRVIKLQEKDSKRRNKKLLDIHDCLELFTASEILEQDTTWKCKHCKKAQQASKQLHLWRLPDILIVQLKRFVGGNPMFGIGYGRKLDVPVNFPVRGLDLTPYLSSSQIESLRRGNNSLNSTQGNSTTGSSSDDTSDLDGLIPKYDLCGIVDHHGIMEFGHYTATVRSDNCMKITNYSRYYDDQRSEREQRQWIHFNDEMFDEIDENRIKSPSAYLLFYRRRTDPKHAL